MSSFSTADLALARRLEAAEAVNGFRVARVLAQAAPGLGVAAEPFFGGCALFGGLGSPLTHAVGVGMNGPGEPGEFDRLESFFRQRGSPTLIDLCPMADPAVVYEVTSRGYRVIEFNNVMVRRILPGETWPDPPAGMGITLAAGPELATWNRTIAQGFQEREEPDQEFIDLLGGNSGFGECYLASLDGAPSGGGAMAIHEGVACLFGDSTVLRARRRGVQTTAIHTRLRNAAAQGCDLAMASVLPGSGSHRNYEKAGFQLLYMRVNVSRP